MNTHTTTHTHTHRFSLFSLQAFRISVLSLLLPAAFSACSKTDTTASATAATSAAAPAAQPAPAPAAPKPLTLPAYSRGMELVQFSSFISATYAKFQDPIKNYKEHTLSLVALPLFGSMLTPVAYDALKPAAGASPASDDKSGKLMMSGWNATRTRSGDQIRGSATDDNAKGFSVEGARLANTCVLDLKTNTLVCVTTVTHEGAVISREIAEARIAPDKTVFAQVFTARANSASSRDATVNVSVTYYRMNGEQGRFQIIAGRMQTPAIDFTYDTFAGQPDPDIDALAAKTLPAGKQQIVTINDGAVAETTR